MVNFEGESTVIRHFFPVKCKIQGTRLAELWEMYRDRIPTNTISIANDCGGNLFLLKVEDASIWFWDHEGELEDEHDFSNMEKVANNFNEFVEMLSEE